MTTRTEKIYPPVELVQECSEPTEPVEMTWRSLAGWLLDYKAALRQCNNDKELLQKWMSES